MIGKAGRVTFFGLLFQIFILYTSNCGPNVSAQDATTNDAGAAVQLYAASDSDNDDTMNTMANDFALPLNDHQLRKRPGARYIYNPSSGYGLSGGGGGRMLDKRPGGRYYGYFNGYDSNRVKRPGARYFAPVDNGELLKRLGARLYAGDGGGGGNEYNRNINRWKRGGARYMGPNYYGGRRYGMNRNYRTHWGNKQGLKK